MYATTDYKHGIEASIYHKIGENTYTLILKTNKDSFSIHEIPFKALTELVTDINNEFERQIKAKKAYEENSPF